jgi:hypothetical protein
MMEENMCPKHNMPLNLRRNVKTSDIALACPLCDVEQHGSSESDVKTVSDVLKRKSVKGG